MQEHAWLHLHADTFMLSPLNCILVCGTLLTNRPMAQEKRRHTNDLSSVSTTIWQIQIMWGDMSEQDEPVVLDKKQNKLNLLRYIYTSVESMR
jgi:hypothetical protein